ncbi:MAG: NUDIX hydrolase [Chloroflexaceae bacterium]
MSSDWRCERSIVTIDSPWVKLLGERWIDDQGQSLEYWRVEKAHSVIVLPIQQGNLLLPHPQFRPGVGHATLDFPGGRLPEGMSPVEVAPRLLQKELGIAADALAGVTPLNETGWIINSSFSNQLLYGVVAELHATAAVPAALLAAAVPCDRTGVMHLLQQLDCLQCRAVLQEFWLQRG